MKKILAIVSSGLLLSSILNANSVSDEEVSKFISKCRIEDDGGVYFDPSLNLSSSRTDEFRDWFKQTADPLEKLRPLVGTENGRWAAVFFAAGCLDDDHFYRISLRTAQKFAAGEISEAELFRVIAPPEEKRGLLAVSFRNPDLVAALEACLAKGFKDFNIAGSIKKILSGESAKDVLKKAGDSYPERYGPLAKQALEGKVPSLSVLPSAQSVENKAQVIKTDPEEPSKVSTATTGRMSSYWPWIAAAFTALALLWFVLKRRA
jgi:hypothetical protein